MTEDAPLTGGCQCGGVRYALRGQLDDPHICHCRMCQKAFGSFFAPLVGVKLDGIEWTRGQLATYHSSTIAERGFCRNCGTPLTFRYLNSDNINVSIGSLDEPECVKPARQYGMESRVSWLAELADLPGTRTEEDMPQPIQDKLRSHQYPDHE